MKVSSKEWDVRCPNELRELFPKRSGYYFRVNHEFALKVLHILSSTYQIPSPKLSKLANGSKEYAKYIYQSETVLLRSRTHLKTIFHEFYHHLDNMTDGAYDSDDQEGGATSLAWIFAEKLWAKFTLRTDPPDSWNPQSKSGEATKTKQINF